MSHFTKPALEDPIINRGRVGTPLTKLNTAKCLFLRQFRTWIFIYVCHDLCCVQWFNVRVNCLLCRYQWNCWPSMLKFSFLIFITVSVTIWSTPHTNYTYPWSSRPNWATALVDSNLGWSVIFFRTVKATKGDFFVIKSWNKF